MPGFMGHTVANSVVLVGTSAFMYTQGWSVQDILAVDAGILISTLVLSPDMDLFTSRPMEDWGLLRVFWWPYSKIVKHRDRLHTPILGTSVRWLYTIALASLVVLLFRFLFRRIGLQVEFNFNGDRDDMIYNLLYVVDVFVGANLADATHFFLDIFTHGLKHGNVRHYHHYEERRGNPSFGD